MLDFMYQGEVKVGQDELNSFLALAEDLCVKGLTQNNFGTSSSKHHQEKVQPIVKSEPVSAPAEVVPQQQQYATAGQQSQQQVALEDDAYADESYDYGEYGDGGYDDGSGMIDPNTGLPIQGAGGADGNKGRLSNIS